MVSICALTTGGILRDRGECEREYVLCVMSRSMRQYFVSMLRNRRAAPKAEQLKFMREETMRDAVKYVDDSAYDVCVVFNFHVRRSVTRLYEAAFATADSLVDEYGVTNFVPYSKPKRVSTTAVEVCVH
jgi:hypothetical protein